MWETKTRLDSTRRDRRAGQPAADDDDDDDDCPITDTNEQADEILAKCRKEKRQPTPDEQKLIDEVEAAREVIIQVDAFPALGQEATTKGWKTGDRPALQDIYGVKKNGAAANANAEQLAA